MAIQKIKTKENELIDTSCHVFEHQNQTYRVSIAQYSNDLEAAFSFMYQIYRDAGLGTDHASCLWFSTADLLPTSTTIVVKDEAGDIVASVSCIRDSNFGMPLNEQFGDSVGIYRERGYRLSEVYSLGLDYRFRNSRPFIAKLFNIVTLINFYVWNCTHLAITIVPRHTAFYRRCLMFEDYNMNGFHRRTGVECKLLYLPIVKSLLVENPDRNRTCYRYYLSHRESLPIIETLRNQVQPIRLDSIRYFHKIRPELAMNATGSSQAYFREMLGDMS